MGGMRDAGGRGGGRDAGSRDIGDTDSGSTDAGSTDTGSTDTGSTDTGSDVPGDGTGLFRRRPTSVADRVARAMAAVPREAFLPPHLRHLAGVDAPLPLGGGPTCSQPTTVRQMLELLDARPGQHVLDVGSGSGWTTALLVNLTAPGGSVVGVELDPTLVAASRRSLEQLWPPGTGTRPDSSWRVERAQPGVLGWPGEAPFDRILVSADARGRVPQALVDQLGPEATLVIPVQGTMTRVRMRAGRPHMTVHGQYMFVPLVE